MATTSTSSTTIRKPLPLFETTHHQLAPDLGNGEAGLDLDLVEAELDLVVRELSPQPDGGQRHHLVLHVAVQHEDLARELGRVGAEVQREGHGRRHRRRVLGSVWERLELLM